MAVVPSSEQFARFRDGGIDGPVVMLNLLKFKEQADGEAGTGADAYRRYGDEATKMVEARGGRLLWHGKAYPVLIGDDDSDQWDYVALVEYPSATAFVDMVTNRDYLKSHEHREHATVRSVLLPCRVAPGGVIDPPPPV